MPELDTRHFGRVSYRDEDRFVFPRGLPGFEEARAFVPLSFSETAPLVYLQSLEDPGLCFLTLPLLAVEPRYRLQIAREDLAFLGLAARAQPRIGYDVLCLTVVSLGPKGPTANLLAPIVVNLRSRQAVQALCPKTGYSHRHPLLPVEAEPEVSEEAVPC
jgi:flagellar assembly factor FliW